jgi:predicted RNA-binding protein with TRAM domain
MHIYILLGVKRRHCTDTDDTSLASLLSQPVCLRIARANQPIPSPNLNTTGQAAGVAYSPLKNAHITVLHSWLESVNQRASRLKRQQVPSSMELPDQLRNLFSARIEATDDTYRIEIPKQEVELGTLQEDEPYRVAIFEQPSSTEKTAPATGPEATNTAPTPPVTEGETRTVEIEHLGDQGDGIARVDRGYVVIVPDTDPGERVTIEITDVQPNVAFADVTERLSYYD